MACQRTRLITNCPLVVSVTTKKDNGKNEKERKLFTSEKTSFLEFNPVTISKIKEDIAKKKGIDVDSVDLTKFFHIRTTLSIPRHREIVEQEMGDFLRAISELIFYTESIQGLLWIR